jgi:hypothetical protein
MILSEVALDLHPFRPTVSPLSLQLAYRSVDCFITVLTEFDKTFSLG